MAPIHIVGALFILALGSTPCLSKLCSEENIRNCFFYNDNDCPYSRKQVKCMEEIDTRTCSEKNLKKYTRYFSRASDDAEACPGLPDGICYFNAMQPCEEDVPYKLVIYSDLREDQIKKMCKEFKGKEDEKRACFKAAKTKCKRDYILRAFDEQVQYVDDIQKKCATYE